MSVVPQPQTSAASVRVVGILANIVPYHHARWQEFAAQRAGSTTVLEVVSGDCFKVLETQPTSAHYIRRTLFNAASWDRVPVRELKKSIFHALTELRPDVVCLSGYAMSFSLCALEWCCANQVPVVVCSETNWSDFGRNIWLELIKKRLVSLCLAGLVGGVAQADYLISLGLQRESVFFGYDVVDNRHFAEGATVARAEAANLRTRLNLPEHYFLACGRFEEKKNHLGLIKAYGRYRELAGKNPKRGVTTGYCSTVWPLVLLGEGRLRPQLEAHISSMGLQRHVILPGAKNYDELPHYYGLASVFVHPSLTEQWGLVVNEAMAAGLPVIVGNRCGCVLELVQQEKNGFSFDASDIEQLAKLMLRVSAPDFPLQLFSSASGRLIENWGPSRFASGMTFAVEAALKARPRPLKTFDYTLLRLLSLRARTASA